MQSKNSTVVLLSGGLDSSTLLFEMRAQARARTPGSSRSDGAEDVLALSVCYGQRHVAELEAARLIAFAACVEHVLVDLDKALQPVFAGAASSQLEASGIAPPDGHYAEDNMRVTVVPNRNMMLLSIAGALAVSREAQTIAYAAHAGDHAQYPDCRQVFIDDMTCALSHCHFWPVLLSAPFSNKTKADIVRRGAELGVPFGLTRSCYNEDAVQCGRCGTCVERREAFALAGVLDPTEYSDRTNYWKTVCAQRG